MKEMKKRKAFCFLLLVVNLAFIWGNSLLPGEVSGAFSRWIGKILEWLFSMEPLGTDQGHGLLRKLAHFGEFCTLGLLLGWMTKLKNRPWWLGLLFGVAAACIDESIQLFVPGRGPALRDVCIDAAGVLLGVAVFRIFRPARKKSDR